ncbi:MAG: 16S rRNA (guanine(966)-N(2))-methyltransferase RsmD, partial [Candidatus Bipolaricaulia bacterium]
MRIIGGSRRGRRLVDWEEAGIRPVRDFVRTALFSIVSDFLPGAVCLDLFAGTGSLGLEALSRGAKSCLFVDHAREACGIIRRNAEALDFLSASEVFEGGAVEAIDRFARRGRRFDLVFIDPPYFHGLVESTLSALTDTGALTEDPVVVAAAHKKEEPLPAYGALVLTDCRRYGDNQLVFYRPAVE